MIKADLYCSKCGRRVELYTENIECLKDTVRASDKISLMNDYIYCSTCIEKDNIQKLNGIVYRIKDIIYHDALDEITEQFILENSKDVEKTIKSIEEFLSLYKGRF